MDEKIIHIEWEGPLSKNKVYKRVDVDKDYGIYQIYGRHPAYGKEALLYIGIAKDRPFGTRIREHDYWLSDIDSGSIKIYLGSLYDEEDKEIEKGREEISLSEQLLIYVHTPAYNKNFKEKITDESVKSYHILNYYEYCDLLPEVSGARWSDHFGDK